MKGAQPIQRGKYRYDWWRAHHGLPHHAKWRGVSRATGISTSVVFHIAMCLLDAASRASPRGSISDFRAIDCLGSVDATVEEIDRVVEALREHHWIEGHMLAQWDERQPQREDATGPARKAAWRSRHVTHENDRSRTGTHENASEREERICHAPDRDKDKESKKEATENRNGVGTTAVAAREPGGKRPSEVTRAELEQRIERTREAQHARKL